MTHAFFLQLERTLWEAMPHMWLFAAVAVGLLVPGAISAREYQVEKLAGGFVFAEGPVWHPDGYLLFSDVHGSKIYKVLPDGKSEVWFDKGKKTNGLVLSSDARRLFACCYSERELIEIDPATREYCVLTDNWNGRPLNNVNDIILDRQGNLYFTDPKWGAAPDDIQGVYCFSADGATTLAATVDNQPNGIALSPDQEWLFVTRSGAKNVMRFRHGKDGRLTEGAVWSPLEEEPDGMTIDSKGTMYVALAGNGKICVLSPEGKIVDLIQVVNKMATNCALQGGDESILYVTGKEKEGELPGAVFRVRIGKK